MTVMPLSAWGLIAPPRRRWLEPARPSPQMIHRRLYAADVIVGSLSLLMPGSMLGEVTPVLAQAVLESSARKVLLPLNKRKVEVVGVEGRTLDALIDHALQRCVCLLQATA